MRNLDNTQLLHTQSYRKLLCRCYSIFQKNITRWRYFFYKPTHCQKQRFQPQFKLWKACCCIVSKSQLKSKPPMIWKSAKQDTFRLSFLKRLLSYTPKRRVVGGLCPDNLYGLVGIFFRRQGESQEIFPPYIFAVATLNSGHISWLFLAKKCFKDILKQKLHLWKIEIFSNLFAFALVMYMS